jgi:hypothetical protein
MSTDINTVYNIYYDKRNQIVVMDWVGYATSAQLKEGSEAMLNELIQHGAHKVLADTRDMALISSEDRQWIEKDFLPRAMKKGFKAVALVKPLTYHNAAAIEAITTIARNSNLQINIFDHKEDAIEWLNGQY